MSNDDIAELAVSAIELAGRAPSIHNSQPWQCAVRGRTLHLYADERRWLPATDADHRDLMLSCGAMLDHLMVALRAVGLEPTVHRLPNPAVEDHLAALELRLAEPSDADIDLARAIAPRRTDRRPYPGWEIPDPFLRQLAEQAANRGTVLRAITDPVARDTLLSTLREAAAAQREVPGYDTELAVWTGRHLSDDGVPAASLLAKNATRADAARDFPAGNVSVTTAESDGAVLLVLGTASDDRMFQLRAGEAMSAVLLRAVQLGLAGCPLSQPLEIPSARRVLQGEVLDGTLSPQLVLRIGFAPSGPKLPETARRPVAAILRTESDRTGAS